MTKEEKIDDITNEIMDEVRDYFLDGHDIDLHEFFSNNLERDADDEIYSIIHNKLNLKL